MRLNFTPFLRYVERARSALDGWSSCIALLSVNSGDCEASSSPVTFCLAWGTFTPHVRAFVLSNRPTSQGPLRRFLELCLRAAPFAPVVWTTRSSYFSLSELSPLCSTQDSLSFTVVHKVFPGGKPGELWGSSQ